MKTKAQLKELFSSHEVPDKLLDYLYQYGDKDNIEKQAQEVISGIPIQYVVGNVDFYHANLEVNEHVLIPRFETEELVYKTIQKLKSEWEEPISIADIGTGSGCIAISMKQAFPNSFVTGVDISKEALELAKKNGVRNHVEIDWKLGNLLEPLTKKYDCIISNPPYIGSEEEVEKIVSQNEPHLALYASEGGYYNYHKIFETAKKYLNETYLLAFEIGNTQGSKLKEMALEYFKEAEITVEKDMSFKDRFLFIRKK